MATAKRVREVTGQAIGGVEPVGHPEPVRTVIDGALAAYEAVWAAAGTPHTVVPLTVEQLVVLTSGPRVQVATD
jgi:prolyl-tRNA editing enzyme YbaK/EbsC (Cys-tRNA(Pro) deacylase)